jgi:hypothetical protein
MSDLAFWFLLLVSLTGGALLASMVIQIKRIAQQAFSDALNGCAAAMR